MTEGDPSQTHGDVIYKICPRVAWLEAITRGELAPSADDVRDGFVHLSAPLQVRGTLARHYTAQRELMLLEVRVELLPAGALHWELSREGKYFPHLYGALPVSAVSHATLLSARGGDFELPEGL